MEKIDVAVIGIGGMGGTHVEATKASPYVDKVYGCDVSSERTIERCKELNIIPVTLEEIWNNPKIKMVSIASSNDVHVSLAKSALAAGKAVLCEKPMGETLEEAKDLLDFQQKTGGFLQIGFELHYSKLYQQAKEWIDAGLIGDVVNVQCRYYCSEFHRKNTWRSNSQQPNFLLGEKLSHYLDLQRWYFAGQNPETIYSVSAPKVVNYFGHNDNHQAIIKFSNGGVATLNFIMYIGEHYQHDPLLDPLDKQVDDGHYLQYHICGTKGIIETDVFKRRIRRKVLVDGKECIENSIVEDITFDKKYDQEYFHNVHGQNLRVIELVAKGLPSEMSALEAYETMKLCFAVDKSQQTGELIDFKTIK